MSGATPRAARERKPAAVRRTEILQAAATEFAHAGLAGARLDAIAARAEISHPRVVQMFGSKQALFLEVIGGVFDRVSDAFNNAEPSAELSPLTTLGQAYLELLGREPTVGQLMLHAYAASHDDAVKAAVAGRQAELQHAVARLAGVSVAQARAFFSAGLALTVSSTLGLANSGDDAAWGYWLLELVAAATPPGS